MKASVWAVVLSATAFVSPVGAQPLVVPFLPQTEKLCGGAAAAMVMRYWGARDVFPDTFAPLVDRSASGIHTSALVSALTARRWTAVAGPGDMTQLTRELTRGRPVIALIEDRPGRFHYVVVVSAADAKIVLHDPARAPSRIVDRDRFDTAWQRAQRWMLILLPPAAGAAAAPPEPGHAPPLESPPEPEIDPVCAKFVYDAVGLAQRGEKATARRALDEAAAACPRASAPWRELAGLDALDGNWPAAAEHARHAVAIDPDDGHAWRVLATSEFLQHHDLAALAAWNRVGEPRTDLVNITGLAHTRYLVVADAIGVRPGQVLTPDGLRVAQRRVLAVPAIAAGRVSFQPRENGEVQIDAALVERPRAPTTYVSWAGIGLRAITERQLATSFAGVSGGGDLVTASWRWWAHRPMIAASYAAPGPGGIWRIDASRETQTFGIDGFEETRTRAGAEVGRWVDERTRVSAGASIEHWTVRPRTAAASGRVEFWPVTERLALEAGGAAWRGAGVAFGAADAAVRWRSSPVLAGTVWRADAGYRAVTTSSPASLWPGGDTGPARDVLLRAHPLLDDGVIRGGVFGRRLAFGTVEIQRWVRPARWPLRIAPAAFIDIARATRGLPSSSDRTQVDAGAGFRLSLPGMGVLRVDLAHGLRDGRTALSAGWQR